MLTHLRVKALEKFKTGLNSSLESGKGFAVSARDNTECSLKEFEQGCADAIIKQANWDCSKMLEKVRRDIEDHALSIRESKLSEMTRHAKDKLRKALAEPVESLFDAADQTTWQSIRNIYKRETDAILPEFLNNLCQFEMEYAPAEEMVSKLKDYARSVVESKAKEESSKVLIHMKERFTTVFSHDKDSIPRVWTGKEDVRAIAKEARSAALKLLSVMAAIRWDDEPDRIESILTSTLLEGSVVSKIASAASADPLASTTWEEIAPKHTMITPSQCKSLWKQFKAETEFTITQAVSTQQAHRRGNSKLPPPWAIVAIAILGFNEIMVLIRNPIYLFLLFVGYLMVKALAMQLDVSREFQNGVVPGIISVSVKLLPAIQNLVNKVAAEQQAEHQQQHPHPHPHTQAPGPPQPQMQPPPLLLSPRSPMSELRRLHMPRSPRSPRKVASPAPSSSSSSSAVSSPRHVGEDQKPRPGAVGAPENEATVADSIV
ncbi:Protein ROOT HAIR DEFECTIVE 3 homolog 2 [Zea mays]|nr:Protein ROOT HAIR DEFECTIVE 3 homolog 2 [Zea mays]ONM01909.1 Protein ROOT HAIR DEFECTIVE 3 homolog 2 [Zea mays]ONM01921.1 Protein ROOT HAIR DEFECTIVE 3 homolog 2 [Zea mays]